MKTKTLLSFKSGICIRFAMPCPLPTCCVEVILWKNSCRPWWEGSADRLPPLPSHAPPFLSYLYIYCSSPLISPFLPSPCDSLRRIARVHAWSDTAFFWHFWNRAHCCQTGIFLKVQFRKKRQVWPCALSRVLMFKHSQTLKWFFFEQLPISFYCKEQTKKEIWTKFFF